jgi:hypothetical protein
VDSKGRVFVGDRSNNRVQVFDQDGSFLEEWKQFGRPSAIFIDQSDNLYVADNQSDAKNNSGFKRRSIPFDITGECQQILWQPTLSLSKGSRSKGATRGSPQVARLCYIFPPPAVWRLWPPINFSA